MTLNDSAARVHARINGLQPQENFRITAGADEKDDGERHLCGDQGAAQAHAVARRRAATVLENGGRGRRARSGMWARDRRSSAVTITDPATNNSTRPSIATWSSLRQAGRRRSLKDRQREPRDEDAEQAGAASQHEALGQQLTNQANAAGANRHADRDLCGGGWSRVREAGSPRWCR